ncbi:hypothetical protein C8034_v010930 [Colletotrichum sidae]|uniref:Uncharacterized protein n=1 Tax=Colletotrichum sidae TaxID=1347389 RepID=A0A4R8TJS5_9PEZI|nr:hypothetical protein C8034_v010930 [Colletotrichum sidae]
MDCTNFIKHLLGYASSPNQHANHEKPDGVIANQPAKSAEDVASEFVDILRMAEKGGKDLERRLKNIVVASSWTEGLAKMILSGVETLVQNRDTIGKVAREAIDKATELALALFEWAKEHPVFVTLVALGVLVIVAPWVIEALGFGELGPIADTFASWWQARYAGYVPKGSLFSFLQRLGMTWG